MLITETGNVIFVEEDRFYFWCGVWGIAPYEIHKDMYDFFIGNA